MPANEFWNEDPSLFWAYRFSYINKLTKEYSLSNQLAWLQGAYIYEAVSVALSNAFSKQTISYRSEPYDLLENNEDTSSDAKAKNNILERKLKERAKQVEKLLGNEKNK